MYCRKCGREIPDNTLFCTYCGEETGSKNADAANNAPQPETKYEYRRKDAKTRRFVKMVLMLVYAALIIIGLSAYKHTDRPVDNRAISSEAEQTSKYSDREKADLELVKQGYLEDFSQTVRVGEAFDRYFGNPQWYPGVSQNSRYVLFSGMATRQADRSAVRIDIVFLVTDNTFKITAWQSDRKEQPITALPSILKSVFEEEGY